MLDECGRLLREDDYDAYTLNNITAAKDLADSVSTQFGGYAGSIPQLTSHHAGLELHGASYRPRGEILNGTWTFSEAHRSIDS